ncbi:MAG: hypothetical protein OES12_02620 [Anaerolineae bacterium]|jgi:hypothetical protein|nr:hypothetical protein [Anaerolineae bacterium]
MTTTADTSLDLRAAAGRLTRQLLIWVPIVVGIVHQILMGFFGIDRIFVLLTPPTYIYPFVTLGATWWYLLTVVTGALAYLAYRHRLRPRRTGYPFYFYLLFLLIFVKPI